MQTQIYPRIGLNAFLRSRWGIITEVEPYDTKSKEGVLHLVTVEYSGTDGGGQDTVIWEREPSARVLEISKIHGIESTKPMKPADFTSMVNASRWNSLSPFISPFDISKQSEFHAAAPYFGALQAEDYQMLPLAQALSMERISLLLADDVGLGKTIEAGPILTELLLRRKIRRVLILTPASLKQQWHQEMKDRFNFSFEMIDRESTLRLKQNQGLDANPWRILPKAISSYYYLRQPDVLEQFLSTCRREARKGEDTAKLPWDLLIVDEAHNLMPPPFGQRSELTKMLHEISPYFEHKLFLTATPHNGHTRSFTGLLELLDPVRFVQKAELTEVEKRLVKQVVIRRLKNDINSSDRHLKKTPRFVERHIQPAPVYISKGESLLYESLGGFKDKVKKTIRSLASQKNLAGSFAVEVLSKRLLSCPYAFADSWERVIQTLDSETETVDDRVLSRSRRIVDEEIEDDNERESRVQFASSNIGAWLKPFKTHLSSEINQINRSLQGLRLFAKDNTLWRENPPQDSRIKRLLGLIETELREGDQWKRDERLIIFTEYKTTLDYIYHHLKSSYADNSNSIALLYGGSDASMNDAFREGIKQRFNDPNDPVRILIATDTASEGLNLQNTAHRLLHFDIPWNPSRLEQRNGRLDRHGQARDVIIYHFTNDENMDLKFLARVVEKTESIREDLGSMGELFDYAFKQRLLESESIDTVFHTLDYGIQRRQERKVLSDDILNNTTRLQHTSDRFKEAIQITPDNLMTVFNSAISSHSHVKDGQLEEVKDGFYVIKMPPPAEWRSTIDLELRLKQNQAMPRITFDPALCKKNVGGRNLFYIPEHVRLLHLGHPLLKESIAFWARQRQRVWVDRPGNAGPWTYGYEKLPDGVDAIVRLYLEELGINQLRETFHHWVRSWEIPLKGRKLGPAEPFTGNLFTVRNVQDGKGDLLGILEIIEEQLPKIMREIQKTIASNMEPLLESAKRDALDRSKETYSKRLKEVSLSMRNQSIAKLEKELSLFISEGEQSLFDEMKRDDTEKKRRLEEEIQLRTERYKELRGLLESERNRIVDEIIPRKYVLSGELKIFPVGFEIVLPEAKQ